MPSTFLTADLHFYHQNILKFCSATRPYATVEEMHQAMITHWQNTVGVDDHVWILGDLFFCNETRALAILDQLPGVLHLVSGNHDSLVEKSTTVRSRFATVDIYKEIKLNGLNWVFFHYPIREWARMHYGAYHCHGHTHGKIQSDGRSLDVGWDGPLGGGLVTLDRAHEYLLSRPILTHHGNGMAGEQIIGKEKG